MTYPAPKIQGRPLSVVKIRTNRQVTIPKVIFDALNLNEGDFVEVSRQHDAVLFQPKKLINRDINEALTDIKTGRVLGPFNDAQSAIAALKNRRS